MTNYHMRVISRGVIVFISTIVSTQVFTALSLSSGRTSRNVTATVPFKTFPRPWNYFRRTTVSALVDKKTFLEIYHAATKEKHAFLYLFIDLFWLLSNGSYSSVNSARPADAGREKRERERKKERKKPDEHRSS